MSERELAVLWRLLAYTDRYVICRVFETDQGLELRIERDGEVHLSEIHTDQQSLLNRSSELRNALVEKGWTGDLR